MYGRRVFSQLSIFQTLFCWFYIFRKKWKFKSFWSLVKTGSHSFPWTWRLSILTDGDCVFLLFALNQLTNFWRFKLKSTFQEKKIYRRFFLSFTSEKSDTHRILPWKFTIPKIFLDIGNKLLTDLSTDWAAASGGWRVETVESGRKCSLMSGYLNRVNYALLRRYLFATYVFYKRKFWSEK